MAMDVLRMGGLAGLAKPAWNWFRRQRAGGWPIAEGRIESVEVNKPTFSFATKRGYYVAELGYSYSVARTSHSGRYKREFPTEHEAEEFVRDLKGKPVAVHCNSTSPSSSALLEPDIDVLLQNRAPAPAADFPSAANSVPDWIRPFLWVFVLLSGIGLIVSLWVHLGAVMGRRVAPEAFFWMLHAGIFVVWFPAVFVALDFGSPGQCIMTSVYIRYRSRLLGITATGVSKQTLIPGKIRRCHEASCLDERHRFATTACSTSSGQQSDQATW